MRTFARLYVRFAVIIAVVIVVGITIDQDRVHLGLDISNHPLRVHNTSAKERLRDEDSKRCKQPNNGKDCTPRVALKAGTTYARRV